MKFLSHALCLALCLVCVSCGGGGGLEGTWTIDADGTVAANKTQIERQIARAPEGARAQARERLEKMFRNVEGTFDFKPDKTLVSQTVLAGKKQSMSGTWELDEDKVTVRARKEGGKERVMSGTVDGDKITMSENGTDSFIVLKRQ